MDLFSTPSTHMHPINVLPVELLRQIFMDCFPRPHEAKRGFSLMTVPLLLTHVCSVWRAIALQSPELWSNVCLDFSSIPRNRRPAAMHMLEHWLALGGTHPLSLQLYFHDALDTNRIISLVSVHASRWQDVHLAVHPTALITLSDSGLELPQLRRLSLDCWIPLDTSNKNRSPLAFRSAPRLSDVSLTGKLLPCGVDVPWTQLTFFSCRCADFNVGLEVLKTALRLEHLCLDLDFPSLGDFTATLGGEAETASAYLHASLLCLTVRKASSSFGSTIPVPLRALLRRLNLPALQKLVLPALGLSPADCSPFAEFAVRSPALASLMLTLGPLPAGALLTALRPLNAVTHLELRDVGANALNELLRAMVDISGGTLLPALGTLHIDGFREYVPYDSLLAALKTRRNEAEHTSMLRSFKLAATSSRVLPDAKYLLELQNLKAQGMSVSIFHVHDGPIV